MARTLRGGISTISSYDRPGCSNTDHCRFDYQAPFNPRGDLSQKPSGSSTGSAVACAAYPWLDFTVGTDTGGSIRHPAGVNGIYGFRPPTEAVDDAGVFSISKRLDTVGVFARSVKVLEAAMNVMLTSRPTISPNPQKQRYKLLYPQRKQGTNPKDSLRWFPFPNEPGMAPEAENKFELFVKKLEAHLSCSRTIFNIDDLWRSTRPSDQPETLDEASGKIYTPLVYYENLKNNINPFISEYSSKNHGRKPWIDPVVRNRFDARQTITHQDHKEALHSASIFSTWVNEVLFRTSGEEIPLLIFPQSFGQPDYCDDTPKDERLFWDTFSVYSIAYLGGGPDVTVPVGEVSFQSKHTGREEWLPVAMSIVGRRGSDVQLLGMLRELGDKGILKDVHTGRRIFRDT